MRKTQQGDNQVTPLNRRKLLSFLQASAIGLTTLGLPVAASRAEDSLQKSRALFYRFCLKENDEIPNSAVSATTGSDSKVRIRLKGQIYNVPTKYLGSTAAECRSDDNNAILILPPMFGSQQRVQGNSDPFTLLGSATALSPDAILTTQQKFRRPDITRQVDIGLPGFVVGPLDRTGDYGGDVYVDQSEKSVRTVILCHRARPEYASRSFCSLWFMNGKVTWQVSFNRRHLAEWKSIAELMSEFLKQSSVGP